MTNHKLYKQVVEARELLEKALAEPDHRPRRIAAARKHLADVEAALQDTTIAFDLHPDAYGEANIEEEE